MNEILWLFKNNIRVTFRNRLWTILLLVLPLIFIVTLAVASWRSISVGNEMVSTYICQQRMGFLIMLMMICTGSASKMILKEKLNRTYYRISFSHIKVKQYLLGNVLANMLMLTSQTAITLFIIVEVFHIDLFMPIVELLAVLELFELAAIGLSLVIVAYSKSIKTITLLYSFVIIVTCMLSGCFWPMSSMPQSFQSISYFIPQRWALDTVYCLQKGAAFKNIVVNLCVIIAFAITFIVIAVYKLCSNENTKTFV